MDTAALVLCDSVLREPSFRAVARRLGRPTATVAAAVRRVEAALARDLVFASGGSLTLSFEARRLTDRLGDLACLAEAIAAGDRADEDRRAAAAARPVTLAALGHFLEALAAGSIRKAAQRLGMGQPQLTRQLSRLEETLGLTLLARGAGGCRASADGARIAGLADQLVTGWADLTRSAPHDFRRRDRTLHVGSIVPLGHESRIARLLARLVDGWQRRHRRYNLHLSSTTAEELVRELKAGRLDFALIDTPADGVGLSGLELSRSRLAVVGPPGFAAGTDAPRRLLESARVAVPSARSGLRRAVQDLLDGVRAGGGERVGESAGRAPAQLSEVDSLPVIVNLVRFHGHVSVLPLASVAGIDGLEAHVLPADHDLPLVLAWRSGRDYDDLAREIAAEILTGESLAGD